MKKLFTMMLVTLFCVPGLFAQDDSTFVSTWTAPVPSWWAKPSVEVPARAEATAVEVTAFDAVGCDFDEEWAKIPGTGNALASVLGLAASHKGPDDFKDAAFKVFADESNLYVLLQYTDDDVTGNETVELAWAPYLKVDAGDGRDLVGLEGAWYTRYVEFGAYKATFKTTGFDAAMMVTGATANVNWGGTNEILSANLFLDDHTTSGSSTIKMIYTIGYAALTGEARPDFDLDIWESLNSGKGISFDMKVNDIDTDDEFNTDATPAKKPAEYWWNTTSNDCYALTWYAGFLGIERIPVDPDAEYTASWTAPVPSWWAKPAAEHVHAQASAIPVATFDAVNCDFDAEWAKLTNEYAVASQLGLAASHKGPDDFKDGGFKVLTDDNNIYILLQYTDDDVTGSETVELAWAPYYKINAAAELTGLEGAWYTRYVEFGAYKATFKTTGFDAAMMVTGATANVNWGGTNEILSANLFMDDHTELGSTTIKHIYTIGYAALTGDARPEFNQTIWDGLNEGKGISFDMKVNDIDTDDEFNTDATPAKKPAEYWWNTTSNDCYALTWYAGFLNIADVTSVPQTKVTESIFSLVTPDQIQFNTNANVVIYNMLGQQITSKRNVRQIELSGLEKGIYIVRANNESRKIMR